MEGSSYLLPKYKNEKIYNPYRCPYCYKMIRIKIFVEGSLVKYNCQCKKYWYISYKINEFTTLLKPGSLDLLFNLKCSSCNQYNNLEFKHMHKCLTCNKLICSRKKCKQNHSHNDKKNIIYYDITCDIHSKEFIAYCKICDKDLCESCELDEKKRNHEIIYYKDIMPTKEKFLEKYDYFNKLSDFFVTQFKGVPRKTNVRLIYFFHIREILRNCYINFSRYSKINKFNFALISNVLENSDFIENSNNSQLVLDYQSAPTCLLNSSKYFFTFLEEKNSTKINFLRNSINNNNKKNDFFVKHIYTSFPKKKFFIIQTSNFLLLYNSQTLEQIYNIGDFEMDDFNFEDEQLIYYPKKRNYFRILKIDKNEKKVTKDIRFKNKHDQIFLMENSVLLRNENKLYIYDYNGNIKSLDIFSDDEINIKNIFYFSDNIIYFKFQRNNIFFYEISTKKQYEIKLKDNIIEIKKLNEKHIILKQGSYYRFKTSNIYYVVNIFLKQVVNKYCWKLRYITEIVNEYILLSEKNLDEIKLINSLTSIEKTKFHYLKSINKLKLKSNSNDNKEQTKIAILNKYIILFADNKILSIIRL